MNALLEPQELAAMDWEDLGREEKQELLLIALEQNPKLLDGIYGDLMSRGVDAFDYWSEL